MSYECVLCGKTFTGYGAKSGLDSHLRTDHPAEHAKQQNRYRAGGRGVKKPCEYYNAAQSQQVENA